MKYKDKRNEIFVTILQNPNLSEGEIAGRVGLRRTPYTRKLLLELVAEGNVLRWWDASREPGAYVYCVQQTEEMPL